MVYGALKCNLSNEFVVNVGGFYQVEGESRVEGEYAGLEL